MGPSQQEYQDHVKEKEDPDHPVEICQDLSAVMALPLGEECVEMVRLLCVRMVRNLSVMMELGHCFLLFVLNNFYKYTCQ